MDKIIINIQMCSSWSYRNYFRNFKESFEKNFKNVVVNGYDYPLSGIRFYIYIISLILFGLIVLNVIFSNFLKPVLKILFNEDHIKLINENKLQIILISYFVLSLILNNINNTGAFEIFYNNQLIFSKLNSGNFPDFNQLIKIMIQKGAKFKK